MNNFATYGWWMYIVVVLRPCSEELMEFAHSIFPAGQGWPEDTCTWENTRRLKVPFYKIPKISKVDQNFQVILFITSTPVSYSPQMWPLGDLRRCNLPWTASSWAPVAGPPSPKARPSGSAHLSFCCWWLVIPKIGCAELLNWTFI